ncbi:SubName: Full=Uncharacterized protein {ECO:0000313/EMBL:CCA68223.1} [Serendipita indica DSM 11827]|nr:SubName: Full=Uncharacterized protein {ECO:0000313/EMBL:CCA68223.1} [Serendipita indica DSM 11827]
MSVTVRPRREYYSEPHTEVYSVRFFESGRMRWLHEVALEVGGEQGARDLLQGKGISLILKKIDLDFKANRSPILTQFMPNPPDPAHLLMHSIAYSNAQERVVTESNAVCVWYDYDNLRKARDGPPSRFAAAIERSLERASNAIEEV